MELQVIGYNPDNNTFFVNYNGEVEEWCSEDWRLADCLGLIESHKQDYTNSCHNRRFEDTRNPQEIKQRLEETVKFGGAIENLSFRKICQDVTKWVLQIR